MSPTQDQPLSFPRHSARTRHFTLGRPAEHHGRGRRLAGGLPPVRERHRPGQRAVGPRRRGRSGAAGGRPRALLAPVTTTYRPRNEPVVSGCVRSQAASSGTTSDAAATMAAFALSGTALPRRSGRRRRDRAAHCRPGDRSAARPDRLAHRLRHRRRAARRRDRRLRRPISSIGGGRRGSRLGSRGIRRRRGDGPLPRLLVGARRAAAPRRRASTSPLCSAGTSPILLIPTGRPTQVRYPAAGTPNAVVSAAFVDLDGGLVELAWDTDAPSLPRRGGLARGPVAVRRRAEPRPAWSGARGRPAVRRRPRRSPRRPARTWVPLTTGLPAWLADGRLVRLAEPRPTSAGSSTTSW